MAAKKAQATRGAIDLANERGIDVSELTGSGAGGKVTKDDVQKAIDAGDGTPPVELSERETQKQAAAAAREEAVAKQDGLRRAIIHKGVEYPEGTDVKDLGKLSDDEKARLERLGALPE